MTRRNLVIIVLAALLGACASSPDYPRLDRARVEIEQAQANPLVAQYAPAALAQAEDAFTRAQATLADENPDETEHLAYLAERRAQIAVARAQAAQAREAAREARVENREALRSQASAARVQALQARSAAESARQQALAARVEAAHARAQAQQTHSQLEVLQGKLADLHPRQTPEGIVLTLGDVLFGFDEAELNPSATPTLDELAEFLSNNPEVQVVINGYTDSVGSEVYNERLSRARAEAVAGALERRGITSARLTTHGYGESNPIATNATEAGRTKNRRVEFVIKNIQQ
ncbi:MAG TPA: OmpA family protein [Gammaproteobacteria bacterium]|nr:OmpA family protein [Gammaproteobacteria bacterium]